jgi:rRNA processing protein Krr1/Pno1
LECTTQELTTVQIDCPKGKLGSVIGKNGTMIKQIMESAKVTIEVHKLNNKINITGSEASVALAVAEIDKITRAIEDEFDLGKELLSYLTAKYVNVFSVLQKKNQDIYFDLSRNSGKAILRGTPERVEEAKKELLGIEVVSKDRALAGREFSILLGKKGATIDKLVAKHAVFIDVKKISEDTATAVVIGPPSLVEDALTEIEELMNDNREVIENITVDIIVKRILLSDTGSHIKAIQAKVNEELKEMGGSCHILFAKDQVDKDHPEICVKAKQPFISKALELTEAGMKEIYALRLSLTVDPYIVPRIIGKGGDTIKKLTQGKPAFVEVDRKNGIVYLGATTVEERDALLAEVNQLIEENAVLRLKADAGTLKAQFREFNRSKSKAEIASLTWLDIDEDNNCFILRGKKEDLEKAKTMFEDFLANNHVDEVAVTEEDLDTLLSGGKGSKIMKLSEEMGVTLFADRSHHVVVIRGSVEKVDDAKQKLGQFLNGGDGHSVVRISANDQVVGVIIGKGGKNRKQLEEKYEGVSINISKTHRVSIHGPEDTVTECRVEILKMISSARVTQTLSVSEEQHKALQKNDAIKRITQQAPAHITIADGTANIRGLFYDVRDVVSLLNEQLTGVYTSAVELDASQFVKVRGAARDSSHFERMESESSAKVSLDLSARSIAVSGKRSNVRKAKDQVFLFLAFIVPGEIERMKISKPLYSSVGQATSLAEISASVGGATVYLDRDVSSIIVRSPDQEKVKQAVKLVDQKIKDAERLAYVLEVLPAEAWLIPLIIGKNGNHITALQKDSGCHIDVSRESRTVTVIGDSEESVKKAREKLDAFVEKGRRGNVFMSIPEKAIAAFVGKGGNHVKELSIDYGVDIQRVRKGPQQLKITGDGDKVEAAKNAIEEWLAGWDQSHASLEIPLEKQLIPIIIGHKGETARLMQDEFGCRIDVDRQGLTLTVRGGSKEKRENCLKKIEEIIDKEKAVKSEVEVQRKKTEAAYEAPVEKPKPFERIASNDSANMNGNDNDRGISRSASEFPTQAVGVSSKRNGKKNKKVDTTVQRGTEQGRNLFQLLVE